MPASRLLPTDEAVEAPQRVVGNVGGELHQGEVRTDLDRAEVLTTEAALICECADDLARLDLVPTSDLDAVCCGRSPAGSAVIANAVATTR